MPDRFIIYYNKRVFDSGYRGNNDQYGLGKVLRSDFTNPLNGKVDPITGKTYPFEDPVNHESDNYLGMVQTIWLTNKEFIDLIPNFQVPLIIGSSLPLKNAKTPRISDASQFIIDQARILPKEKKLYLIILGFILGFFGFVFLTFGFGNGSFFISTTFSTPLLPIITGTPTYKFLTPYSF